MSDETLPRLHASIWAGERQAPFQSPKSVRLMPYAHVGREECAGVKREPLRSNETMCEVSMAVRHPELYAQLVRHDEMTNIDTAVQDTERIKQIVDNLTLFDDDFCGFDPGII